VRKQLVLQRLVQRLELGIEFLVKDDGIFASCIWMKDHIIKCR